MANQLKVRSPVSVMEKIQSPSLHARLCFLRAFASFAACSVALVGVAVLTGWVFGIGFLKTVVSGWVTMMVNTACVLIAASCAGEENERSCRGALGPSDF